MQRDKRGRFMKGNTIAKGNKGNKRPKYGNRNAVKHGMHEKILPIITLMDDGNLLVEDSHARFVIKKGGFYAEGKKIRIKDEVAEALIKAGLITATKREKH